MTEEILQAAIQRLKSKATEELAIIKDIYHRPSEPGTVDRIANHALNLVQYEGAALTLAQYGALLARQTESEEKSNMPEEVTEVLVEQENETTINEEQLEEISPSYRKSMQNAKLLRKNTEDES